MMMDDKRLRDIKARAEAAQKQWENINNIVVFAIHARADIPDLIAEVERLGAENTRLRAELEAENARWEETASDNTGYTLSHLDGIFAVSDPQGHVVCEFLRERTEKGGAK